MKIEKGGYFLTLVDTTGIQAYIFNSNTLKHIMGASGLVHKATHDYLNQALLYVGASNVDDQGVVNEKRFIEKGDVLSEVVYQGGGNALIIFDTLQNAEKFTGKLTQTLLEETPGLDVVVVHTDLSSNVFDESSNEFQKKIQELFQKANTKKTDRRWSQPLPGLGVTAACPYTQKPATHILNDELISSEIYHKEVDGSPFIETFFKNRFQAALNGYQFIEQFNQFSAEIKGSYMAVVHADGTGMRERILRLIDSESSTTREKINSLRKFSNSIKDAVYRSMNALIKQLVMKVKDKSIPLASGRLPFRPIVVDGDDITFVCDGNLALSITALFMKEIAKNKLSDQKGPISCRAGIAIVKSHFPFSRAYTLSEELNRSARSMAMRFTQNDQLPPMAMDWHISTSGEINRLEVLRKRYHFLDNGHEFSLYMRPVLVDASDQTWRTWDAVCGLHAQYFNGQPWKGIHSKVRGLREVVKNGTSSVNAYIQQQNMPSLPHIPGDPVSSVIIAPPETGELFGRAIYFDALEAEEFIIHL